MDSFYTYDELCKLGFSSLGTNVRISKKASFYGLNNISIGNNVRIDDFCVLSGNILLGNNIHIAPYCGLYAGSSGIEMQDYSGLSSRCTVYAESDDYSGYAMTNPTVPLEYRKVTSKKVIIGKHALIGTGSTILPGVKVGEGVAVWSMTLVSRNLKPWSVYFGIPCKLIGIREKHLLEFLDEYERDK